MNTFLTYPFTVRCLAATLTVPLSLLLTGCGSSNNATTTSSTTTSSTTVAQTSSTGETATTEPAATAEPVATTAPAVTTKITQSSARTSVTSTSVATKVAAKPAATKPAGKPKTTRPAAKSPYRVASDVMPGAPPPLTQALAKAQVPPPPMTPVPPTVRVRLVTSKGPVVLALNGKAAPLHVRSFTYLARRGFYNGTVFHRYADLLEGSPDGKKGPIIQGGDPLSRNPQTRVYAGMGGPGYQVPRERNTLKHEKLVVAAARSTDPDSAGSQFYITQAPVPFLDDPPGYTVFGKVVEGAENALKLAQDDKILRAEVLK